ncbi:hypothetical protein SAMN05421630_106436 [Prauserella marina]|uniref:Uncharacterized protein n=1 Tax=Prauserella marina TaxID=530584 RepID=A0A1G6SYV7_9PSEU|nr:hypothetical protein [Prauserella marina]PWV82198.1 hypothetical protein DES30_102436 [Prauserella marina]SDD21436.1 hypothetical protein SAMN05421630_106436 [Prauserella marina]
MNLAENTVGIGPWSFSVGPFAIVILAAIIGVVLYYSRKDD